MRPSCVPCLLSPLLRSRGDTGDLDRRVLLAVTLATAVTRLVLVAKDVDLRALVVVHDLGLDLDAVQDPRVAGHGVAVDNEQGRELDRVANLGGGNLVNLNDVADSNLVLATTAAHDGVHADLSLTRNGSPDASRPHGPGPATVRKDERPPPGTDHREGCAQGVGAHGTRRGPRLRGGVRGVKPGCRELDSVADLEWPDSATGSAPGLRPDGTGWPRHGFAPTPRLSAPWSARGRRLGRNWPLPRVGVTPR